MICFEMIGAQIPIRIKFSTKLEVVNKNFYNIHPLHSPLFYSAFFQFAPNAVCKITEIFILIWVENLKITNNNK